MRIAVLGCGAVGGVIAACLTRAGNDVTAIVLNPRIESALLEHGFHFRELDGPSASIPPSRPPIKTPREAEGTYDLVVTATPSTAMESALREILPFLARDAIVVTCQNGLPEDRAIAIIGDRVVGCVVGWGATMEAPGVYRRTSRGRLQIGKPNPAAPSPDRAAAVLRAVSTVEVVDDLAAVRWSKLAINCVTSPFGAIGGEPLGALLKAASVRRLALEVFAEAAEVARREGVTMQPVAGTLNIARIAIDDRERSSRFAPSLLLKHALLIAIGFKFRRMRSSMLYAIERGRPIEIDYLNGEIVRRGERRGFPTPVNRAIVATVRKIEQRELTSSPATLRGLSAQFSQAGSTL
jgi:2-dehydropantoate 2-reductase